MAAVAKVVTTPGHMQNSSSAGEYALISGTNDSTTTAIKNGISSSTSKHHSTEKHSELNERRYDLNSFAPVKLNPEPSDGEDDLPLSVRKQQKTPVENNVHKENHRVSLPSTSSTPNNNNNVKIKIKKEEIKNEVLSPVKEKHSTTVHPEKVKHEISSPEPTFNSHKSPPSADRSAKKRLAIVESDDEDEMSLSERAKKVKQTKPGSSEKKVAKKRPKDESEEEYEEENEEEEDDDYRPSTKKSKHDHKSKYKENGVKKHVSSTPTEKSKSTKKLDATLTPTTSPKKRGGKKKEEEQQEVWRWWEEEKHESGVKWKFLEHKGPMFASAYECLPESVKFYYGGKPMKLSEDTEEVATFYAKMLDHDYTAQEQFNKNFFKDWRKVMTSKEREKITDLKLCDFKEIGEYFKKISEERRNRSKEEKLKEKEEKDKIQKEFGIATIDGHKEKIGNFRIEPPGLFRGRGTHPKMGMLKKRILPEDVIINCSKDSKAPQAPHGHKWKEVRHDNTVTWLASWSENIMGNIKYVMLNPASKIKGEKDWQKYETARKLKTKVSKIRTNYREDWKSKEMKNRQRAVALYFIDKLALRAGNEKEEGETADTVGCCSLRCEHIKLHEVLDGEHSVVEFDFLGKDSIRYYNKVSVEKRVFKNLKLFMENKQPGDDVFDRLNTMILNKHLTSLMEGLTAKVFRTYNASFTLQQQLDLLTKKDMTVAEKLLAYNRANRQVAILCNHQRSVPKAHSKQMETLQEKIKEKAGQVKQAKKEAKEAKRKYKESKSDNSKKAYEQKKKQAERLDDQLQKLELRATDKEENKEISLGTSKLNYLDPRISVAWCKKWEIPIEKIYNKTQREKFRWAIDMATATFVW